MTVGPASTDHDPLKLRPGAEVIVIKDARGWNGGPGSAPSILGLGRITHPSPSLNTVPKIARAGEGARRPGTGELARPAHSRGPLWAKAHTSLGHKGAPSLGHPALSGSPPPARLPPLAARCSRKSPGSCSTLSTRQAFLQEPSGKVFAETPPAPYREVLEELLLLPHLQDQPPFRSLLDSPRCRPRQ